MTTPEGSSQRRAFLKFLAASPIFATGGHLNAILGLLPLEHSERDEFLCEVDAAQAKESVITGPDQAIDVFEFEAAAQKALPPAHFGYLATGVDDDNTVRANQEGYSRLRIRARRLVDVTNIDLSTTLLGVKWSSPILICPVGSQKAFHPDGAVAVARAARAKDHVQILSNVTTSSIEDVVAARGGPFVWQQLYPNNVWEVNRAVVKRAESAGCPAIALTVDVHKPSHRETLFRGQRAEQSDSAACHSGYSG